MTRFSFRENRGGRNPSSRYSKTGLVTKQHHCQCLVTRPSGAQSANVRSSFNKLLFRAHCLKGNLTLRFVDPEVFLLGSISVPAGIPPFVPLPDVVPWRHVSIDGYTKSRAEVSSPSKALQPKCVNALRHLPCRHQLGNDLPGNRTSLEAGTTMTGRHAHILPARSPSKDGIVRNRSRQDTSHKGVETWKDGSMAIPYARALPTGICR